MPLTGPVVGCVEGVVGVVGFVGTVGSVGCVVGTEGSVGTVEGTAELGMLEGFVGLGIVLKRAKPSAPLRQSARMDKPIRITERMQMATISGVRWVST